MNSRRTIFFVSTILVAASAAFLVWPRAAMTQQGQSPQKQQTPTIDEYQPKSTLVTKEHKIERAKFPRDGESQRRNRGTTQEHCGDDERTLPRSIRRFLEHELRRPEHAGIWKARDGAPGTRHQERRARTENLQEFRNGPEICERRARARGRSGVRCHLREMRGTEASRADSRSGAFRVF